MLRGAGALDRIDVMSKDQTSFLDAQGRHGNAWEWGLHEGEV